MVTSSPWLIDDILPFLENTQGSHERGQLTRIMRNASKVRLDADLAQAVRDTMTSTADTILSRTRTLDLGNDAVWLEYPPHPSAISGNPHDVATHGVLISPAPGATGHYIGFVAWRLANGESHHSYAILHWGHPSVEAPPGEDMDALDRIAAGVRVMVTPSMQDEMEIWHAPENGVLDVERTLLRTKQAALAQSGFAMTAALILATPDVRCLDVEDVQEDRMQASLNPEYEGMVHRWLERWRRRPSGFWRGRGDTLRWAAPSRG